MTSDETRDATVGDAMDAAAVAERRLLKQEAAAERKLEKATARLQRAGEKLRKAQERYDDRLQALADAEAALDAAQLARADGPAPAAPPEQPPSGGPSALLLSDASELPSSPS